MIDYLYNLIRKKEYKAIQFDTSNTNDGLCKAEALEAKTKIRQKLKTDGEFWKLWLLAEYLKQKSTGDTLERIEISLACKKML